MSPEMEFCLLGPLEVRQDGVVIPVRPGKQRAVLAALLLNAGRLTPAEDLISTLWGLEPPVSARPSLHNSVMRLRQALGAPGAARILTQPGGYSVRLGPGELDVSRFETLVDTARTAVRDGRWEVAAARADSALALWRGEPLADVEADLLAGREVPRLTELWLQAQEACAEGRLGLGRPAEVISGLRRLADSHPLREHLHALLMLALYRAGRQGEALACYQQARQVLISELGTEPGRELRRLQQQILGADPALVAPLREPGRPAREVPVPRELPGPVMHFVGREDEMRRLTGLLDGEGGPGPGALLISAIGGTAGVGKTALAVEWARRVVSRFPDGQLYVNLHGYDPEEPMAAADALARFLRALGVPGPDIPEDASERAARFRSLLAGRRMLVVLDNAEQVEQVRPLLPGSSGCVTLVTSRDSLAGLVARDGAIRVDLDLLPATQAVRLLRELIGARVDADPDAAEALAVGCARLPLALRVAAEVAVARPAASLAEMVAELTDQQRRLDLLDAGGDPRTGVRAVFSWSCQHLDPAPAALFRGFGLHPGQETDQYAAAALVDATLDDVGRRLAALAGAHLIQGAGPGRFLLHDLLRAFAAELAAAHGRDSERYAALSRLLGYYLHTAAAAMDILYPSEMHRRPRIPDPGTPLPTLAGPAEARAWLDTELGNLVALASHAASHGWPRQAVQLSATLFRYLGGGGHFPDAMVVHGRAAEAARALGDHAAEATALSSLSQIDLHHGHGRAAAGRLEQALGLFRAADDRAGEARVLHNLATVEAQEGQYQQAGEHHRQALRLHQASGNQPGAARALSGLGDVDLRLGRYRQAREHLQQALTLCHETSDRLNEAYIVALMGDLSLRLSRYQDATERLTRALRLFREAGDQTGAAWALAHLGSAQLGLGRGELAISYQQQAVAMARETRDRFGEAEALNALGEAQLALGRPGEAGAALALALGLASQTGDRYEQARAHAGLARSYQDRDPGQALLHSQQALELYDGLGTPEASQLRAELASGKQARREPSAP
jgi:DNA-binding SARP family transcriptional activator/tetratricopeptide (TPR) repeat protein